MADKTMAVEDIEAEFENMAQRAGIEIFEDRRAAMLTAYIDLKNMLALLRDDLPPELESANIFHIESIRRET